MAKLFVDNLTVIDCSYLDTKRGIVGESWMVDVELTGTLDEQGMVFDFGHVKKQIKHFIDQELDHRLLVPSASTACHIEKNAEQIHIDFALDSGGRIRHQSPHDAVFLVNDKQIDSEQLSTHLEQALSIILPDNVSHVALTLRSDPRQQGYYHYSHGLQKHLGQCQRIAHGHRSPLAIYINGQRNNALEAKWANTLQDSYIATQSHLQNTEDYNAIAHSCLAYTAAQGDFAITLPSSTLFFMPVESTVENIAVHLAQLICQEHQTEVLVKAFEGPDKGAFGHCRWQNHQVTVL